MPKIKQQKKNKKQPSKFEQILRSIEKFELLDNKRTLVCSLNELNLYLYYGNIWSPIKVSEIQDVQVRIQNYLESNFNQIYNDGSNSLWISSP